MRRTGSSPRMRGKPRNRILWVVRTGLIPAHAGKTPRTRRTNSKTPAHPRACGENLARLTRRVAEGGSSPRVRGKPALLAGCGAAGRLIPACAGKTQRCRFQLRLPAAHPRVCGENSPYLCPKHRPMGSSPRVRGKLIGNAFERCPDRLIPACAGKTALSRAPMRAAPAHPRVCGEN